MKTIKLVSLLIPGLVLSSMLINAQNTVVEKTIPLSKSSSEGYFFQVKPAADGSVAVTFEFLEKKIQKYEVYQVDSQLKLLSQVITEKEPVISGQVKEDYTRSAIWASIGGSSSFDVLSSVIKVFKVTYKYTWNKNQQKYDRKNGGTEKVVLKNIDDKNYVGYIAFGNDSNGELMALTSVEQNKEKKFFLLNIKTDLSVNEIPIKLNGNHTLVYAFAAQKDNENEDEFDITDGDMVFIFAPKDKAADTKKYVYIRYDNSGKLLEQFDFTAPSPNLAITAGRLIDNDIFLFGAYTKSKDAFGLVFNEYGPIPSPGYAAQDNTGSENYRMFKYNKAIENEEMVAMVCMKIAGGKIEWQKDYPIKEMEKFAQKAPSQKKAIVYDGKALAIQKFKVLSNGDMLVSGQISGRVSMGVGNSYKSYKKLICFHFDKSGNIRAQYGAEPESINDKKNTIFPMVQDFILSSDGNTIYWMVLENESQQGYDGLMNAYNGTKSWWARYYPSMIQIDASKATLKDLEELGSRNYYLNKRVPFVYSPENKNILFIGRDLKNKTLWLCRYPLN